MSELNLFGEAKTPLADRVRPESLLSYQGQKHVVGDGQLVNSLIQHGNLSSLIIWGPPGSGKTTLARIIAGSTPAAFEEISAVTSGLADVKKVIDRAHERRRAGQATLLFVDEIHRFNKAQQDAFLPHVENGTITLIGATTENPSFEVIGPLLSRTRVIVLEPLGQADLLEIISRAMDELPGQTIEPAAAQLLATLAAGDARVAINGLETAASLVTDVITTEAIKQALQKTSTKYDKNGEHHYNFASALIKSMRGGSVDAALFYLARMLSGGEDPKFIARRLVVFASEDIGVADNSMLTLAVSTFLAVERIGMPECQINLSHTVAALSLAPKSRASYDAFNKADQTASNNPMIGVPVHLRNAPTDLMRELGYGERTEWKAGFVHPDGFMPEGLRDAKFWRND